MTEFYLRDEKVKTVIEIFRWADEHTDDKYIISIKKVSEFMTTMEEGDVKFSEAIRYIDDESLKYFRIRLHGDRLIFDIAGVFVEGVERIMGIYLNKGFFDEFEMKYEIYR